MAAGIFTMKQIVIHTTIILGITVIAGYANGVSLNNATDSDYIETTSQGHLQEYPQNRGLPVNDTELRAECLNHEDCLFKDLFAKYNKFVRPVKDPRRAVQLTVTLVLNSLMDIKEKDELMSIVGFLRTFWYDEFLTWDPEEYGGVNHLIIPAELIWLPDIAISNSASHFYDISYKRDFHVEIESDGKIRWAFGGIFISNCHINLKDYPFDSQSCSIEIENWMYVIQDVNLGFAEGDKVAASSLGPSAVWYLHSTNATRAVKYDKFASLRFTLTWKRKTLYYYVNIVIPIVMMLTVAMGVFWLPAECGEKISLAITIVLAFSVFQIIIMDNTPVNSDVVPEITALVMLVTVLAITSLLTSMLVVYISGKSTNRRPPAWLRTFCFKYLATVLFMRHGVPKPKKESINLKPKVMTHLNGFHVNGKHDSPVDISSIKTSGKMLQKRAHYYEVDKSGHNHSIFQPKIDENDTNQSIDSEKLDSIAEMLQDIRGLFEDNEENNFVREEWRYVGKVVDRCAFWFTLTVLISSLAYIWAPTEN